jgi:hypothetical protein
MNVYTTDLKKGQEGKLPCPLEIYYVPVETVADSTGFLEMSARTT